MQQLKWSQTMAKFLLACLLIFSLAFSAEANAVQRKNPEAGKKKAAKRIGIGAAAGGALGGLIGGRKGALIGAGVGAGGGTVYHVNKKRKAKRHRRY